MMVCRTTILEKRKNMGRRQQQGRKARERQRKDEKKEYGQSDRSEEGKQKNEIKV